MCICAEPDIGFALPILQIVDRLGSPAREVRDLVAMDAVGLEEIDGSLIEVRDAIFRWHIRRAVAFPAEQDFRSEAALVIDFQHANGHVWRIEPKSCV